MRILTALFVIGFAAFVAISASMGFKAIADKQVQRAEYIERIANQ